jgi:hydrogenase maturation protein HypF
MIATGLNTPFGRGVGRWFDAFGSLVLGRPVSRYEGEVAMHWNLIADPEERGVYPMVIEPSSQKENLSEIDPRPMVRAVVEELAAGCPAAVISAKFHNSIAAAVAEVARASRAIHGELPVVLTGGCFQNALLAERTLEALAGGPPVYLHREVPPGDGGLALGQALVADAISRSDRLNQGGI